MQESLDEIVQLSCFRVPWVCTKPTLTVLNIFQYQRWYYIDLACCFSVLWWRKTPLTTLNQYNPCQSAFGELTTSDPGKQKHPILHKASLHSLSYYAFPYPYWKVQSWRTGSQIEGTSFSRDILFLLLPFLNCWPRGPSARYQTAICIWSHTGR